MAKTAVIIVALMLVGMGGFVAWVWVQNQPLPQDAYDVAILERAVALLATEDAWSRQDDRHCEEGEAGLSLYCALQQASIEVRGEFHHRAAALQAVRHAIEAQRPEADYAHRLMDYNNDATVTFDDMHAMLDAAAAQLERAEASPAAP